MRAKRGTKQWCVVLLHAFEMLVPREAGPRTAESSGRHQLRKRGPTKGAASTQDRLRSPTALVALWAPRSNGDGRDHPPLPSFMGGVRHATCTLRGAMTTNLMDE